jgi:tape measure domain-containing protein
MNLELFIRLKDMMSSGLVKIADTARKTTNSIKSSNDTLAQSYDTIKRKINDLESVIGKSTSVKQIREARRELEGLQRLSNKSPGNLTTSGSGGGLLRGLLPALGIAGALSLGGSSFQTALANDSNKSSIDFATNGQGRAAISGVKSINEKYGLNDKAGFEGFKTLAGSVRSMNLPLSETLRMYESVGAAGRAMGVDSEAQKGIFVALGQIASKGTVSAEELRGQIGERLPGAFGIAAKAMGVTEQQLGKMMQKSELLSKDFLPKFATEMQKTFGDAAAKAASGPAAVYERFNNTLYALSVTLGEILMPSLTTLMKVFIDGVQYVREHQTLFEMLGVVILSVAASFAAYNIVTRAYSIATSTASFITKLFAGEFMILNYIMSMNPVGLVIAAIAALVAVVIYAWNKFAPFRAMVLSTWEVLKGFGEMIKTYVVDRFYAMLSLAGALGNALKLLFKGEFSQAWDATKAGLSAYGNATADSDKRIRSQWDNTKKNAVTAFVGELKKVIHRIPLQQAV